MPNTLFLIFFIILLLLNISLVVFVIYNNKKLNQITKNQNLEYNLMIKIQSLLKTKTATNTVTEHAEMIYQDLLQNLIPIMAAIDVMPRQTQEHPLWRSLGGILDEYAKNPFALEKLRRSIKLDTEIARNVDNYIKRADGFLQYLSNNEPDGILTATFTDGLLGQSITFFTQAKQLANQEE